MTPTTVTFRVHSPCSAAMPLVLDMCRPALESDTAEALERALNMPGYGFKISTDGGGRHDIHCDVLLTFAGTTNRDIRPLADTLAKLLRRHSRRTVEARINTDASFKPVYTYPA